MEESAATPWGPEGAGEGCRRASLATMEPWVATIPTKKLIEQMSIKAQSTFEVLGQPTEGGRNMEQGTDPRDLRRAMEERVIF